MTSSSTSCSGASNRFSFTIPRCGGFPKGFAPNANTAATILRFVCAAAARSTPKRSLRWSAPVSLVRYWSVAAADGIVLQRFRRVLGMSSSVVDWQSAVGTLVFLGVWLVVGMWQSAGALQATPAIAVKPPVAVAPTPVATSVSAIAAILTAQPVAEPALPAQPPVQAPVQAGNTKGSIQGVVTRAGTSEPIPGAYVAITNAPFDPDALATLLKFWAARGVTMNPQEPGQSDEKYFQTLMDNIAARGISTRFRKTRSRLCNSGR